MNLIQHLTEFQTITDEEIHIRANGNVEEELLLHLERDFVQNVNKEAIKCLMEMIEKENNVMKPIRDIKKLEWK
jgi:CHASE3 domain sensor protein